MAGCDYFDLFSFVHRNSNPGYVWRVLIVVSLENRAWKNVNFAGSLSRFPVVRRKVKTIVPLWHHKPSWFSWKRCNQESSNHWVHVDKLRSIQPTSIDSHSRCKQLHRPSVPRYRSVRRNEILKCKSGKSSPRCCRFSRRMLVSPASKICFCVGTL